MKKILLIVVIVAISDFANSQVTNGLVGYFNFNNGSFADLAGNQDCVLSANGDSTFYLVNDRFENPEYAIDFQGAVLNAGIGSRDITNEVTVSLWMKTTVASEDVKFLINKYYCVEPPQGYHMITSGNSVSFGGRDNTSNGYMYSGGSEAVVNDGEWHHVVGLARAEGNWEIWVDAQMESSNTFSPLSSLNHAYCNLGIAGPNNITTDPNIYNGVMDDVRIYNRALDSLEIDSLFNEANPISSGIFNPSEYSLVHKVSPNPFATKTTLSYELKETLSVHLSVFNQLGQLVYQHSEEQQQGEQQLQWDATNQSEGLYFYQLQAGEQISNGKMVKVK